MAVTLDLVDGHTARNTYNNGWEFERIAIVTGVAGLGHEKIYNAANTAGMPSIGDAHPTVSYSKLHEIRSIYVDPNKVKFSLIYHYPNFGSSGGFVADSIHVGASVIQVETNKNIADEAFELKYTYPVDYQRSPHDEPLTEAKQITQGVMASKMIPQRTLTIQKEKGYSPESEAAFYVGKINSLTWRGDPPATWLCTQIEGYSDDGGYNYKVTYKFQYKYDTWDPVLVFIKDDGNPPSQTDGNSKITERIYEEVDFNNLNL